MQKNGGRLVSNPILLSQRKVLKNSYEVVEWKTETMTGIEYSRHWDREDFPHIWYWTLQDKNSTGLSPTEQCNYWSKRRKTLLGDLPPPSKLTHSATRDAVRNNGKLIPIYRAVRTWNGLNGMLRATHSVSTAEVCRWIARVTKVQKLLRFLSDLIVVSNFKK